MTDKIEYLVPLLIRRGEYRQEIAGVLEKLGFNDPEKAAGLWDRLFPGGGIYPGWEKRIYTLCRELSGCPDPDMALLNLSHLVENFSSASHFFSSPFLETPVCRLLVTILSCSYYLSGILAGNPEYLSWLMEEETLASPKSFSTYRRELEEKTALFTDPHRALNSIKRYRRREILRIGVRDLMGIAGVEDITAGISFLADAVIHTVSGMAFTDEAGERGLDISSWQRQSFSPFHNFAVIAMGKLGGFELNYSSDIDLMYLSEPEGEREESIFYTGLARRITNYLSNPTEEGKLYRVDLRLRPDGESGPLVVSTGAHLDYMNLRGRPWELQALLKARAVTGNLPAGESFLKNSEKLVFSRVSGFDPLEEILTMRRRSVARLPPRESAGNIKLMWGGIRDIEFMVQAYQLTQGRKNPGIRSRNTLESLARLHHYGMLSDRAYHKLIRNYRLFRTIEHRLQLFRDTHTHTLPPSREELRRLGDRVSRSALDEVDRDNFQSLLSTAIQSTQKMFNSSIQERDPGEVPLILYLPPGEKSVEKLLKRFNISEGDQIHRFLHSLVYGDFPQLEPPETLKAAERTLPLIMESIAGKPDPSLSLKNLVKIIKSTRAVRSTLELVASQEDLLRLLLHLSAHSTLFSDTLASHPEFLDPLLEGIPPGEPDLSSGTMDMRLSALSLWYRESLLHIFCQIPFYRHSPDSLSPALTGITGKVIEKLFRLSGCDEEGIALFALGSLGRGNFGFSSDLDLVAAIRGSHRDGRAIRKLQTLIEYAGKAGTGPMDMRLRGEGEGSPLVYNVEYYREYFSRRAGLWELLTFTNCRFICGDEETGRKFTEMLTGALEIKPGDEFSASLREERRKLESLSKGKYDIKHSPGGDYDINFIMSAAELISPRLHPPGSSTEEVRRILRKGLLSDGEIGVLDESSRLFYLIKNAFALHRLNYPPLPGRENYYEKYMSRLLSEIEGRELSFHEILDKTKRSVREVFSAFSTGLE